MSFDLREQAIQMFDNMTFSNIFFVVAYIFFTMSTIKKVNPYNIEMQTLIDLVYEINTTNSLGLVIIFSYLIIIA